jgi:lauroyl/myristoyl acyltransferase
MFAKNMLPTERFITHPLTKFAINRLGYSRSHYLLRSFVAPRIIDDRYEERLAPGLLSCFSGCLPAGRDVHWQDWRTEFFRHYRSKLVEDIIFANLSFPRAVRTIKQYVTVRGLENLTAALQRPAGVLLIGSHLGSVTFGTLAVLVTVLGLQAATGRLIRFCTEAGILRLRNSLCWLDEANTTYGNRLGYILTGNPKTSVGGAMIRALKNRAVVMTNADVLTGGSAQDTFTLFGQVQVRLPALAGAVKVAQLTGATILPWFNVRTGDNKLLLTFESPITAGDEQYPGNNATYRLLCEKTGRILEQWLRQYSTQWIYWDRFGKMAAG